MRWKKGDETLVTKVFHKICCYQIHIKVPSELKITNVNWNNNLSDPSSQLAIEMKQNVETELDKAFCNVSVISNGISENCTTSIYGFTQGSVNVLFYLSEIIETSPVAFPNQSQILTNMKQSIISGGLGYYAVNESSLSISK